MDDRNIIGGSRHNTFNHSLFGNIVLGRTEMAVATTLLIIHFSGTLFWVVLRCMMQTN